MKQLKDFTRLTSYRKKQDIETNDAYTTALYTHTTGLDVVVTSYDYKKKDSQYHLLKREAELLQFIARNQEKRSVSVTVPRVLSVIDRGGRLVVIREAAAGPVLSRATQGTKVAVYNACVDEFEKIGSMMNAEERSSYLHVTRRDMNRAFFNSLLRRWLKNHDLLTSLIKLAYSYYVNGNKRDATDVLTVRDLTATSIVYREPQVVVTDVRRAVFTERGAEYALFPQLYYRAVGTETMKTYLDTTFDTPFKKRQFMRLAAFYAVTESPDEYVKILADSIIPYVTDTLKNRADARRLTLAVDTQPS